MMLAARRYLGDLRRFGPNVARYMLAVALIGFTIDGGIYAVLLNLFLARAGYGPEAIGLVNAVGALTFAVASLPAGLLGERWGSRLLIMVGLGLMAACGVLLPLADTLPPAARMPWLLATITGLYLGLAFYFVNGAPVLLSLISADQRNQAYGAQTALIALAAFMGGLIGGLLPPLIGGLIGMSLDSPAPYRYGLMLAGFIIAPGLLAIRALPQTEVRDLPATSADVQPAGALPKAAAPIMGLLAMIALVRILQLGGLASISTFFNLYLDSELHIPSAQIGLLLAIGRLAGVPSALFTSALSARFGNRAVVLGATLATAVGMLPIILIPHWAAAGLSLMAVFCLSSIRYAASMVYFLDMVPPGRRATMVGVTEMAAGVCFTALAYGGGFIIALVGYQALFLLGAALSALSALVFWGLFRRRGQEADSR